MAKSSRYMQGLLGVIASGRRRKPVYMRQQALVSKLYPFFIKTDSVISADVVYGFELIYIKPPVELDAGLVDSVVSSDLVYGFTLAQTLVTLTTEEDTFADNTVYGFGLKQVLVMIDDNADGCSADNTVYGFSMNDAGIYIDNNADACSADNTIYGFYLGV